VRILVWFGMLLVQIGSAAYLLAIFAEKGFYEVFFAWFSSMTVIGFTRHSLK
jgi:hypothetical protein